MSELKEHQFCECDEIIREYRGQLSNEMRPYYLKSEADKVIAHHKYKRCLAMAKWCKAEQDAAFLRYNWDTGRYADVDFYEKWHNRWLELAEKFKEAKREH